MKKIELRNMIREELAQLNEEAGPNQMELIHFLNTLERKYGPAGNWTWLSGPNGHHITFRHSNNDGKNNPAKVKQALLAFLKTYKDDEGKPIKLKLDSTDKTQPFGLMLYGKLD